MNKIYSIIHKWLPKSRFARSVSLLAGGTAIGQGIVIAASPVLTRLYSPDDFGVLAVFVSLLGILSVIASLRYQLAIPLPENDEDGASVTVLGLIIVIGMTLLTAVIVIPLRQPIAEALNTPLLVDYIWLLPLGLLLAGTYEVFNYWAIRKKAFSAIAQTKLTQNLGMVGVQIGGYALGPIALLLGKVIGQAVGILRLAKVIANNRSQFYSINFSGLVSSLLRYKKFPLISTWSALCSTGGIQLPALLFVIIFGPAAAGLYALTSRVISLPIDILSKSIGDVFYSEAIEARQKGELGSLVVDIYSKMVFVSLPIVFVLFFAAPEIFEIVFGESWALSGELASWMTLLMFFQFVTTPPGKVFLILECHVYALLFQFLFLFITVVSIVVGSIWISDLVTIVALLAIGRSLVYCLRFWKILNLVGKPFNRLSIPLVKNLPYAVLCSLPVVYSEDISLLLGNNIYVMLALFSLSGVMAMAPSIKMYIQRAR